MRQFLRILNNGKVQTALRICGTLLFVYIVNRQVTWNDTRLLAGKIRLLPLLVAVALGVGGIMLQVVRWKMVLRSMGFHGAGNAALKSMLWGSFLAFITPGRLGEMFRALGIDPSRKAESVVAVAVDRYFALLVTLATGFLAGCAFTPVRWRYSLMFSLLTAILLVSYSLIRRGKIPLRLKGGFDLKVTGALFPRLLSRETLSIHLISVLTHVALLLQTAVLLGMFGVPSIAAGLMVAAQAYALMIFLPFFIANAGLREYSFSLFLQQHHATAAAVAGIHPAALGVSAVILFINIIMPAAGGLAWMVGTRSRPVVIAEPV
jgi:hypothetical protein